MTAPQATVPQARILRLIHASMVVAVVVFAVVSYVVGRASSAVAPFPPQVISAMLALTIAGCGFAGFMRRRLPNRSSDESVDAFWERAAAPALVAWAVAEGPSLFGVLIYMLSRSPFGLGVAALGVLILMLGNPASLEKR
jgi:hypothetical protein